MVQAKIDDFKPGDFLRWWEKPYHDYDRWYGIVTKAEPDRLVVAPMGVVIPVRKVFGHHDTFFQASQDDVLDYIPTMVARFTPGISLGGLNAAIYARQADSFIQEGARLRDGANPLKVASSTTPNPGTGIGVLIGSYGEHCLCRPLEITCNPYDIDIIRPAAGIQFDTGLSETDVARLAMVAFPDGLGDIDAHGYSRAPLAGYFCLEAPPSAVENVKPLARLELIVE